MTIRSCVVLLLLQATAMKCYADMNLIDRIRPNVSTSQSSIFGNLAIYNSSKAIDGQQNYSIDICQCCSVTDGSLPTWWQIDLKNKYLIDKLEIFGRSGGYREQLVNASVFASNSSMVPGTSIMKHVYTVPTVSDIRHFISDIEPVIAQFFKVELPYKILTLCEFELYEKECSHGYFGNNCSHNCHCLDKTKCNQVTGKCQTSGCLSGWSGEACDTECPSGTFGVDCSGVCHCQHEIRCSANNGTCEFGCEFGWSGSNCSKDMNLISRIRSTVSTSQSSVFGNLAMYDSSKAIDGLQIYSIDHCECCSVTDGSVPSWWQIDLKNKYLIDKLEIFGRAEGYIEQLENASVFASNSSMGPDTSNMKHVYTVPTISDTRHFISDIEPVIAQFFKVELSYKILTLCEFKLYETECENGYFGNNCSHHCQCLDKKACNNVIGKCQTDGCLTGWQGEACDTACQLHNFGDECKSTCHCINETACDHSSGHCEKTLCDPGWLLPTCSKACRHRSFGQNCSSVCHCINDTNCNPVTGECHVGICDPGWKTSRCDKTCDHNSFGYNCSSTCHCLNNANCKSTTGECDIGLCDPGWKGASCDKACDHNSFGYNCSSTCHCLNNTNCKSTTGECDIGLCDPGWKGPSCSQVCDKLAFGFNCSSTCHCLNNTDCNSATGRCYIELCAFGWQGPRCDEEQNILRHLDVQTDMSSTFLNWTSNLAIDGNIGPKPDVCNCCSGTTNSPISWWTVDMGKRYPINSVTVFSTDSDQLYQQLADFELYLANDTGQNSFHLVGNSTRRIDGNKHVLTFTNKLTRFIKIQRPGVLTLCEVMVYEGECQVGTFGEECSEICHCADDLACDKTSGYCQSDACKYGWIGKSCNQECPKNRFGDRCSETCFCSEGTCTSNYGVCQNGCQEGYTGSHCNQVADFNNQTRPANEEKNSSALIAVVVGGSIAGLIICVLVGVVVVKLRRKRREGTKSHYSTPNSRADQGDQDYDTLDILNDNQGRRNTAYENEVVSNM